MSSCNIITNSTKLLRDNNLIDEKNNVVGPIGKTLQVFNEINQSVYNNKGVLYTQDSLGKKVVEPFVNTFTVKTPLHTRTKVFFNEKYLNDSNLEKDLLPSNPITFQNFEDEVLWEEIRGDRDNSVDMSDFTGDINDIDDSEDIGLNSPFDAEGYLIEDNPQSFSDWITSRQEVLTKLKTIYDYYYKLDRKDPKLADITFAIDSIEKQLEDLDLDNPFTILNSSAEEVERLEMLIDDAKNNPNEALSIFENNDVAKRLYDLNYFFLNVDLELNSGVVNPVTSFYNDFNDYFGELDKTKMNLFKAKIGEVTNTYNTVKTNIVKSAFINNSYVNQHLENGKLSKEDYDLILEKIENREWEVGAVESRTLGLASGTGILGQLLYLKKEENTYKEKAFVGNRVSKANTLWNSIKDEKDIEGNFIINNLFQTDKYGVRMNSLISKYSDSFTTMMKAAYAEKRAFMAEKTSANYKYWMQSEKDSFDRIDIRKIPEIYSKYSTHPRYSKYFEGITSEDSADYQKKLKERLGPIMYDVEIRKAKELLDDYMHTVKTMPFTIRQQTAKNPFAFLQHFYSEDYDKISSSEGLFLEPSYTRFIPKMNTEVFYNRDFKTIESHKGLSEYYKEIHDLTTDYCNPTFQSEGINTGLLDLQTFEDALERESYKNLTLFGKVGTNLKAMLADKTSKYSDSSLAVMRDRLADPKHNRKKLVVSYNNDIKGKVNGLKQMIIKHDINQLFELAEKVLPNPPARSTMHLYEKTTRQGVKVKTPLFYELADSIARASFKDVVSTNIQESVHKSAYLAADIRARRSVTGTLEGFKDVARIANITNGDATEMVKSTQAYKSLRMWGQSNVYGEKFAGNMENRDNNPLTKIATLKIPGLKTHSVSDKLYMKELMKQLKLSPTGGIQEAFIINGSSYEKVNNTFTKDGKNISLEEFSKAFKEYLTKNIGTEVTVGSLFLGYMDNIRAVQLGLSPRAGIKNRIAGMGQTLAVAASGRFGFNLNQYHSARKFLRGINTRQYISKLGWGKNTTNPKYVQIQTLEQLISNLEIQQNRADELALESKFSNSSSSSKIENVKNFFMDFAMNNPEKHNQWEIAVSIMMNTDIKDINGNTHKLFDSKKQEFTAYEPGTLTLKPEFRTPENEAMWENFQVYQLEDSKKSDSIAMVTRIKAVVEKTQGNYNSDDIIQLQNTVHGKLLTMYTRYMYENTNMQFGEHLVDLRLGEVNVKGRKIPLFEHTPTALVYLTSNFSLPLFAGATAFMMLNPWVAGVLSIGALAGAGYFAMYKKFNLQSALAKKEWLLAKDFALETLLLMGKTPINTFSYGTVNSKNIDEKLEKLKSKNYDGLLTEQDRRLISENAQEVATKFMNYTTYTLLALLAKFMYTTLLGDDDDDNPAQKKIKDLVNIENVINGLLNDRNQVMSDINRYLDPTQFYNDATAFAFLRTLAREGATIRKLTNGSYEGKTDQMIEDVSKLSFIPITGNIPNNAKRAVVGMFNKDRGVFLDNRVYEGKDAIDKFISTETKKGEDYYKAKIELERDNLRVKARKYFKNKVEEENPNFSTDKRDEEVSKRVRKFLKETNKSKKMTYQEIWESNILEKKEQELEKLRESE